MNEEIVMHLSSAADRWERAHPIIGFGELRVHDALRDAVRCIKETSAQVPRWISVEEKMPPEDTEVLVYATEKIKGFGSVTAICEYREMTSIFCNKTGRYDWSSPWEYFHVDYKITHWMPLPEPPKEGN